jgi:hypothetical protein
MRRDPESMARQVCVFASEVAAAVGYNPFRTPHEVHAAIHQRDAARRGSAAHPTRAVLAASRAGADAPCTETVSRAAQHADARASALGLELARRETLVAATMPAPDSEALRAALAAEGARRERAAQAAALADVARAAARDARDTGDTRGEQAHVAAAASAVACATLAAADAPESIARISHAAGGGNAGKAAIAAVASVHAAREACARARVAATEAVRVAGSGVATAHLAAAAVALATASGATPQEEAAGLGAGQAVVRETALAHGIHAEASDLDKTEAACGLVVGARNTQLLSITIEGPTRVLVVGRVDGRLEDGTVVETKRRARRLFLSVPQYERVQVEVYMRMCGVHTAMHVETFGDQRLQSMLSRDDALWADVCARLRAFGTAHAQGSF